MAQVWELKEVNQERATYFCNAVPGYWVCCHSNLLHDSPGLPLAYAEAVLPHLKYADTWTLYFHTLRCSHNYQYKLLSDKIAQSVTTAGLISCAHYKNCLILHNLISDLLNYLVIMFHFLKSHGTERNDYE
jgi:hypothetical protein